MLANHVLISLSTTLSIVRRKEQRQEIDDWTEDKLGGKGAYSHFARGSIQMGEIIDIKQLCLH